MARIQHRGHCPHCGRQQAVRNGGMAKHGYTVDYGYFNGTCTGADMPPMEREPGQIAAEARKDTLRKEADRVAAMLFQPPERVRKSYRRDDWVDWAEAPDWAKREAMVKWTHGRDLHVRALRDMADWIEEVAGNVKGQPLLEVKIDDDAKKLQVGDRFKLHGEVYVAKAFRYATARGVGPSLNGQYVEHVVFERDGKDCAYPKRYARKIHD